MVEEYMSVQFRELEAMAQQVKSTESTTAAGSVSSMNQTKVKGAGSPFKGRGSGSPFKCIGLGMIQQINSEKDEDITALKRQIEELDSLASSRQKEVKRVAGIETVLYFFICRNSVLCHVYRNIWMIVVSTKNWFVEGKK
jgi:hypothetical protein